MDYLMEGTSFSVLLLGLITGIAFGLAIYKAGASQYDKILGMLRLKDFAILKFMLTTIIVAGIGVHVLFGMDMIDLSLKPVWIWAQLLGGIIFGVGFALLGYCPGTGVIAAGEGKKDAAFGIVGGLVGAGIFAHFWPALSASIIEPGNIGTVTLSSALGVPIGIELYL
ncbi:MAG: YeeE/YedE family protein [Spirochaeta sp.]|nr:YeeE/YedE family protein [Spirochaeta sp.]